MNVTYDIFSREFIIILNQALYANYFVAVQKNVYIQYPFPPLLNLSPSLTDIFGPNAKRTAFALTKKCIT